MKFTRNTLLLGLFVLLLSGCWTDKSHRNVEYAPNMFYSIPLEPYSQTVGEDGPEGYIKYSTNDKYQDGASLSAMYAPEGTVPRAESWYRTEAYTPYPYENTPEDYELAGTNWTSPLRAMDPDSTSGFNCTDETYANGKVLYERFCIMCHGAQGKGQGILVTSGVFGAVPSYSSAEGTGVKNLSEGKAFHTLTYGKNSMGSYASQLTPMERWEVICYIQEFQKATE